MFLIAAALMAGSANGFAAESPEPGKAAHAAPVPPAQPAAPVAKTPQESADLDARLREARKRLEAAASEVAALSAELARDVAEQFGSAFASGPRRAVIGAQIETGARVREVSPGGPAEAAGIRAGDIIVSVNGTDVKGDSREVVRLLRDIGPDETFPVRVLRNGKTLDFLVTARAVDQFAFTPRFAVPFGDGDPHGRTFGPFGPTFGGGLAGMEVTTLTPQLGRYFGTDKGLLVVRAPQNDAYKLQDGDVILSIDGRTPTSGSHVARILRSYRPGETLTMHIMRDRTPLDVRITLPDDRDGRRARATRLREPTTLL